MGKKKTVSSLELTSDMLDEVSRTMELKNDAALAKALEVAPPVISKLRHGRVDIGASMVIRIHELTGWTIRNIKSALGMPSLSCVK